MSTKIKINTADHTEIYVSDHTVAKHGDGRDGEDRYIFRARHSRDYPVGGIIRMRAAMSSRQILAHIDEAESHASGEHTLTLDLAHGVTAQ